LEEREIYKGLAGVPVDYTAVSKVNPLTYEVNALRGVLLGVHTNVLQDLGVLVLAVVLAVAAASAILPRLVR